MSNQLNDLRENFVGTAVGVVILVLTVASGALALTGLLLTWYDLTASYLSWGEKVAFLVNLPNQNLLAIIVTGLPTLLQLAYFSSKVAGMKLSDNNAFRYLFWASFGIDTLMDTIQMQQGSPESIVVSLAIAIFLFGWMSEFLVIFAGSVFVGLCYRLVNEDGLLEMSVENTKSRVRGGQSRG